MLCAMQASANEEGKKLQDLREQMAAASRGANITQAEAAQAHKQLTALQQAVSAAQQSTHSTQPSGCPSKPAQPCQGSMQSPIHEAPDHMTPTRHPFALWHEHGNWPSSDRSPAGNASGVVDNHIEQRCFTGPPECITTPRGSPVRLTAGHRQHVPNSNSTGVCSAEHAQRAGGLLHSQESALSALHGKLCCAEAEVATLRAKLQAQHAGSSRDALQPSQISSREPVTPNKVGVHCKEDHFTASWAWERAKNPFADKILHGEAAARAAMSGPHAELASVSAQVAQQRSMLQQLTSQVLQVTP